MTSEHKFIYLFFCQALEEYKYKKLHETENNSTITTYKPNSTTSPNGVRNNSKQINNQYKSTQLQAALIRGRNNPDEYEGNYLLIS